MVYTQEQIQKIFRCKFCKVQVVSRTNHHPIFGKAHKKSCPRARNLN